MIENSDAILTQRLAQGEEAAFTEVYRLYRDRIFGFAYRMVGDGAAAEDITHESFVVLIEQPRKYDPARGSLSTYLCGVARGLILNRLRRRYQSDVSIDDSDEQWPAAIDPRGGPLEDLLDRELSEHVEECVGRLQPNYREVFILREYHELSYEEIAAVTECEVATVKTRLYRARQTMLQALEGYMKPKKMEKYHEVC